MPMQVFSRSKPEQIGFRSVGRDVSVSTHMDFHNPQRAAAAVLPASGLFSAGGGRRLYVADWRERAQI